MSLLSYIRLCELIEQNVIEGVTFENVNSASIDLTLGDWIHVERKCDNIVDLSKKQVPYMSERNIRGHPYILKPKEFILAGTEQIFNLPNHISGVYLLNSSLARAGLNHLNAGWADAGWNGSVLTLEYNNVLQYQSHLLTAGMKAGQMVFFEHDEVPEEMSYASRGQYNGDKTAQTSKGLQPIPEYNTIEEAVKHEN